MFKFTDVTASQAEITAVVWALAHEFLTFTQEVANFELVQASYAHAPLLPPSS